MQAAGIIDAAARLPPRNPAIQPWIALSAQERRRESRKMELYAAMVENLDGHVGRLVTHLENRAILANTLIVFMSDNGAANEDFYNSGPFVDYLRRHYDNAYEKMGRPESFVSYDDPWAEAGSAPFSRTKGYTREGGVTAPFLVAGPDVLATDAGVDGGGRLDSSYVTVMDLAPTFLEIAGAEYPDSEPYRPLLGNSLVALFSGESPRVHGDDYVTVLFHEGRAMLRQGDWKLSTLDAPFDESRFELFRLSDDPGETRNLRETQPDKFVQLLDLWRRERRRMGIVLPEDL